MHERWLATIDCLLTVRLAVCLPMWAYGELPTCPGWNPVFTWRQRWQTSSSTMTSSAGEVATADGWKFQMSKNREQEPPAGKGRYDPSASGPGHERLQKCWYPQEEKRNTNVDTWNDPGGKCEENGAPLGVFFSTASFLQFAKSQMNVDSLKDDRSLFVWRVSDVFSPSTMEPLGCQRCYFSVRGPQRGGA